ncbi:MAG: protein phosphatase 2C domain-containing protein [Gallionella sp.]
MNFSIHQASHIGNRKFNQDRAAYSYSSDALMLVLADGMGGHLKGELAATAIIDTFVSFFGEQAQPHIADPMQFLESTMRIAHERILEFSHEMGLGGFPGSTCVAALIQDDKLYWGHAGDSRFYLLRDDAVLTRTHDHSMVSQWVDSGVISVEEARIHPHRNQITNCLGGADEIYYMEPGGPLALQSGDIVLLGSDGLWGPFNDEELAKSFNSRPVLDVLNELIVRAVELGNGRSDNTTGVVVRWGRGEVARDTVKQVCHILEV